MAAGPLVDTSVLIDYFGGVENAAADALDRILEEGPLPATAPVILQEFLQGFPAARDFERARHWLEPFDRLDVPDYELHERAAKLHLSLRRKGLMTSTADALIVMAAKSAARPLLTRDKLQARLAEQAGVDVFR
jgi:predicted nucleic acid-binding protein